MNNQTYEITIDTKKSHCHSNIEFSQHNLNISELIFNITEDEKEFPLKDTDKIIVYFRKPDKTVVFQDKEVVLLDKEKGKIKVLLTTQTLAKSGDVNGEISIERVENGTKKRVSTYGFTFKVRSSIASNDSIESTNEFQVFDKIIKVGEKFEGVDIDGIIAAGELAKKALPKTGGTMTGNLQFDSTGGTKGITWKRDNKDTLSFLEGNSLLELRDIVSNRSIYSYNKTSGKSIFGRDVEILGETNLLKKSEAFTDIAQPNGDANIQARNNTDDILQKVLDAGRGIRTIYAAGSALNTPTNKMIRGISNLHGTLYGYIIAVDADNKTWTNFINGSNWLGWKVISNDDIYSNFTQPNGRAFGINGSDLDTITSSGYYSGSNLKNAPEGMTQYFYVEVVAHGTGVHVKQEATLLNSVSFRKFYRIMNNSVWQPWVELTPNSKDGTTNLIITSDFTPTSGAVQNIVRRGNSVTLMLDVTRNADSTNPIMTTLPEGLRPIGSLTTDVASTDGTMSRLLIRFNGEIHLDTKGKRYRILQTFVTN
ncbi:BppU family phage baseplate upper protein [Bacillus sp. WL1]|uniref:BppU family phage baseplate upper protein n=1 Tax=Bacillus sp. WL1 TaxID=2822693 RepID=UPI001FF0A9C4|nr:BppU family phage baseplate upper protein [Bacillus sp. WL1]